MLRSLMEDKLTASWSEQEKDDRLKELAIALYAGKPVLFYFICIVSLIAV